MQIGAGRLQRGVYCYERSTEHSAFKMEQKDPHKIWHRRLGHQSNHHLSFIPEVVSHLNSMTKSVCDACHRAKLTRSPFPLSESNANECFDLVHCDIYGPYSKPSSCGAYYFLTIVDDCSRAVWAYLMREKSEMGKLLMNFFQLVRTQFGKCVKKLRSDNGLEFISTSMSDYYAANGMLHETSCTGTPQQNGQVERKHKHILEVAHALRFQTCQVLGRMHPHGGLFDQPNANCQT